MIRYSKYIHNAVYATTISFPHAPEARLATYIPNLKNSQPFDESNQIEERDLSIILIQQEVKNAGTHNPP